MTELKLNITGDTTGDPAGYDSVIARVDDTWYMTTGAERALNTGAVGRMLRRISEQSAAGVGERLHHACWVLTSNPEEVQTLGLMHDCATCRAGVDQALAYLRETPGGEIAVGQLYWAA